ncbi:amino acid carrier protein [Candidatus Babeliales bacterium]|nr:amino acid carrier protein [Candidatus Babeliales bacterium]
MLSVNLFTLLDLVEDFTWNYIGVPAIILFGVYFSCKSGWLQVLKFPEIAKIFFNFLKVNPEQKKRGIHPLQAFFAAIGGCIGVGNVIAVCTAVQIGGPGAIFWMWITALFGMVVKYSEIYLSVKYRVDNKDKSYDGGPMYYLKKVDSSGILTKLFCLFMCIYGVDVYIFKVVTHSFVSNWGWNKAVVIVGLLILVLVAGKKGIEYIGKISSFLIPLFLVVFIGASLWIFIHDIPGLINAFHLIFTSAFTGHAATGAFAGSTLLLAMSNGMKRACYTGDIGIGYAGIIHAESEEASPAKQATLGIVGIFLDTFVICTLSVLLIIVTGLWNQPIHQEQLVSTALSLHIPYIHYLWPFFVFLLGYSSLIAFFAAGKKSAKFLWPKNGEKGYMLYGLCSFMLFSLYGDENNMLSFMAFIGVCLLIINMYGIFRLRNHVSFNLKEKK